jgi:hypothetical protein
MTADPAISGYYFYRRRTTNIITKARRMAASGDPLYSPEGALTVSIVFC